MYAYFGSSECIQPCFRTQTESKSTDDITSNTTSKSINDLVKETKPFEKNNSFLSLIDRIQNKAGAKAASSKAYSISSSAIKKIKGVYSALI